MKRNLIDVLIFVAAIAAVSVLFAVSILLFERIGTMRDSGAVGPVIPPTDDVVIAAIPPKSPPLLDPTPIAVQALDPEPALDPGSIMSYNPNIPLSEDLQFILQDACLEHGVEFAVALGLIEVESDFKIGADNGLSYGLMQLNRRYFPDNLPPGENIVYGVEYLGQLIARYETLEAALCAYNAGHDTGKRGYANAVLAAASKWREIL